MVADAQVTKANLEVALVGVVGGGNDGNGGQGGVDSDGRGGGGGLLLAFVSIFRDQPM